MVCPLQTLSLPPPFSPSFSRLQVGLSSCFSETLRQLLFSPRLLWQPNTATALFHWLEANLTSSLSLSLLSWPLSSGQLLTGAQLPELTSTLAVHLSKLLYLFSFTSTSPFSFLFIYLFFIFRSVSIKILTFLKFLPSFIHFQFHSICRY